MSHTDYVCFLDQRQQRYYLIGKQWKERFKFRWRRSWHVIPDASIPYTQFDGKMVDKVALEEKQIQSSSRFDIISFFYATVCYLIDWLRAPPPTSSILVLDITWKKECQNLWANGKEDLNFLHVLINFMCRCFELPLTSKFLVLRVWLGWCV